MTYIDEIAVERAMHGEPVRLTRAERLEVVARLTARGYSLNQIAERLHSSRRRVERARQRLSAAV